MEQNLGFSHREQSTSITFPLPLEGQKSLITHLLRGRNIYRKTWLTVVLILDPNHLPPSLPSCSYILKSSSLLSAEPGLPKPLSLLLQLSSTPLIHSSSSSLLPNPNCFLHNHFHEILLLLKKKTFRAFSELPTKLRSFSLQSTVKQRETLWHRLWKEILTARITCQWKMPECCQFATHW